MRVVVTGAAGFLGRHLCHHLLARGDTVVGLDLAFDPPVPPGVEAVTGSVTEAGTMRAVLDGADAVIHGAAMTGLWARDPAAFESVNAGGTDTVLTATADAGVARSVYISSFVTLITGVRTRHRHRVDETLELPPSAMLGPYPRSKRLGELAAQQAPRPAVIVQLPAPVGPGDYRPTPPTAMLTDLANGRLPALLDCDWAMVDVRALAEGVLAALDRGVPGRRYLLTGETIDTDGLLAHLPWLPSQPRARVPHWLALATARSEEVVATLTGRPPGAPMTGVRLAGPRLVFDNSRARRELGFTPPPLQPALREALVWLRAEGRVTRPLPGLEADSTDPDAVWASVSGGPADARGIDPYP